MSETTTEAAARPYPDIWARESATPVVERYQKHSQLEDHYR